MNHGEIEGSFTVSLYHPCIVSLYYFIDWVSFSYCTISEIDLNLSPMCSISQAAEDDFGDEEEK